MILKRIHIYYDNILNKAVNIISIPLLFVINKKILDTDDVRFNEIFN